jgi:putative methyltransferase
MIYVVLIPRYARVNEHKITVQKAIKSFQNDGYTLVDYPDNLADLQ